MQAIMLAAGMGRRLGKFTSNQTKCMLSVGGKTLAERALEALRIAGVHKLIMVIGYQAEKVVAHINKIAPDMDVEFVYNYEYAETNNIYSLYLAKEYLAKDDTLLLESDLIYESDLIKKMIGDENKNLVAVARYEHWMDGTVVLLNKQNSITDFVEKKDFLFNDVGEYYKTVNIYKLSKKFAAEKFTPFLDAYIKAYGKKQYYEMVLKVLAHIKNSNMKAYILQKTRWYEIDDAYDLDIAKTLFAQDEKMLKIYEQHYGGYWKFPQLTDFCYLVNPYYPPPQLIDKMKYLCESLLRQYPSGMRVQKINMNKLFGVNDDYLLAGNGAAELINALSKNVAGKILIQIPVFNEYIRCFKTHELIRIKEKDDAFRFNKNAFLAKIDRVQCVVISNPNNPSGDYIEFGDIIEIVEKCERNEVTCIIDESFIDFADKGVRYTLIRDNILERYPHLIVIKSISKSYGIPGLRLGVMASSDVKLLAKVKDNLPIWNINSMAEYFMQIAPLFSKDYAASCNKMAMQRSVLINELKKISYLTVYPSQANFVMCLVTNKYRSTDLVAKLLKENNALLKDLSGKEGFDHGDYIRIAVRGEKDNQKLIGALRKLDQ